MPKKSKPFILVVEDDDALRRAMSYKLETNGYEVVQASDGEQALAVIENGCPSIILLDIYMPQMDGLQFLQHLAEMPDKCKVPVIVVTVSKQKSEVAETISGVNVIATIIKSNVSLDSLLETIQKAIA